MVEMTLFEGPQSRELYQQWVKDPTTKAVLQAAAALVKPIGLASPRGEEALYVHGVHVGMATMLDAISHMELLEPGVQRGTDEPVPDYGAERILSELGYNKKG